MSKRSTWGRRYSAKLGAAIIAAAMAVTSFSGVMPGGVSFVNIENNFVDNAKYLVMSPRPYSKDNTSYHLYYLEVYGNKGSVDNFAYLYAYNDNPNKLYDMLYFERNIFETKSGAAFHSCEDVTFEDNHFTMPGNASLTFENTKGAYVWNGEIDTVDSNKAIFRFINCETADLYDVVRDSTRKLYKAVNTEVSSLE